MIEHRRVRIEAHGAEGYCLVESGRPFPEYVQHNLTPAEVIAVAVQVSTRVHLLSLEADRWHGVPGANLEDVRRAAYEELGARLGTSARVELPRFVDTANL